MQTITLHSKSNRLFYISVGLFFVVVISLVDQATGGQTGLLLYLIPVCLSAWMFGRFYGYVTAVASTLTGMVPAFIGLGGSTSPNRILADGMIALVIFALAAFWLARLKRTIKNEQRLARTDYTTGAVNTRYFHDLTEMEIRRFRRYEHAFTVAFIDLDNFKMVNDSYGHQAGDDVLRVVTRTLRANLRETDIVARMGGDEFALLLPETDQKDARAVLSHLQEHLLSAMQNKSVPVTFSIGVVTFHAVPDTVHEIVRCADDLMYSVKKEGKNRVKYTIVAQ
ncbi:MAG: diguanylate cyclase [Desulfobacteraceae bacterium]|nr:MAG: diguanylate cyclase [Desulfobacteraceae bacterium]